MNEQIKKLIAAIKAEDENAVIEIGAEIAGTVLGDLHRIADSLEAIAKKQS